MKLTIVNQTSEKLNTKRLNKTLALVVSALQKKRLRLKSKLVTNEEIVFVFLTPLKMQKINSQFRGKNKPTDVLSFASEDPTAIGELLFCTAVLKKQAKEQKHSADHELAYMMIHGILHLLGYDHEISTEEEKVMLKIQDDCFAQVRHLLS